MNCFSFCFLPFPCHVVSSLCEGRLAAAHVYFHFHDNSTALVHLQEGRGMIRGVPTFLRETYDNLFQ